MQASLINRSVYVKRTKLLKILSLIVFLRLGVLNRVYTLRRRDLLYHINSWI